MVAKQTNFVFAFPHFQIEIRLKFRNPVKIARDSQTGNLT